MKKLFITYALLWIIPALAAILFLLDFLGNGGAMTASAKGCYITNTCMILLTMIVVYTAIKWFNIKYIRKSIEKDESQFIPWQRKRMLLLLVMVMLNLAAYYLTLDNAGLYCALITLVAATMCYPQKEIPNKK